jgi:mono/diheme cytochrome c family protein
MRPPMTKPWPCSLLLALAACEGSVRGPAGPLDGVIAFDEGQAVGIDEQEGTLVLSFEHRFGAEPLALETTYSTRYGQEVSFDQLRYWVSNISLARGDGALHEVPDSYYLVEQTAGGERLQLDVSGIPAGSYDRLTFHLGVDPASNARLDVTAGELERGIGMDWSAGPGYIFFRAAGEFAERGTTGRFVMQTGHDVLYKRLTARLSVPLDIVDGARTGVRVQADLNGVFAALELSEASDILGGAVDSMAGKVAGNYARMFSLETFAERVAMEASSPNVGIHGGGVAGNGTPPVLTEPIVDLEAGLFCSEVPARPAAEVRACFSPFVLGEGDDYRDAGLFSLVMPNDAPVFAASPGSVAEVRSLGHSLLTHAELFMIAIRPSSDSAFWIEYANLKNLVVEEGEGVIAGQLLGGAGDYFDASVGVVSLGVKRQQELVQRLCPTRYMAAELTAEYEAALAASHAAWPAISHDGLCETASLVCKDGADCASPADFEAAAGDVDEGRRIYASSCASCHGAAGEGNIGPRLCSGPGCPCVDCVDHATLARRTEQDMPPEGHCNAQCAADVAAFILRELR